MRISKRELKAVYSVQPDNDTRHGISKRELKVFVVLTNEIKNPENLKKRIESLRAQPSRREKPANLKKRIERKITSYIALYISSENLKKRIERLLWLFLLFPVSSESQKEN